MSIRDGGHRVCKNRDDIRDDGANTKNHGGDTYYPNVTEEYGEG